MVYKMHLMLPHYNINYIQIVITFALYVWENSKTYFGECIDLIDFAITLR